MKFLLLILICRLMSAATMTSQAQEAYTADSVFKQIVMNDKEDIDIRRFALTRINDQSVLSRIAAKNI